MESEEVQEWCDVLEPYPVSIAEAALARLQADKSRNQRFRPTLAEFVGHLQLADAERGRLQVGRWGKTCGRCDGGGYFVVPMRTRLGAYEMAWPCTCDLGQAILRSEQRSAQWLSLRKQALDWRDVQAKQADAKQGGYHGRVQALIDEYNGKGECFPELLVWPPDAEDVKRLELEMKEVAADAEPVPDRKRTAHEMHVKGELDEIMGRMLERSKGVKA